MLAGTIPSWAHCEPANLVSWRSSVTSLIQDALPKHGGTGGRVPSPNFENARRRREGATRKVTFRNVVIVRRVM